MGATISRRTTTKMLGGSVSVSLLLSAAAVGISAEAVEVARRSNILRTAQTSLQQLETHHQQHLEHHVQQELEQQKEQQKKEEQQTQKIGSSKGFLPTALLETAKESLGLFDKKSINY